MEQIRSSSIYLFNKDILVAYVRRVVRREFFRSLCSDNHSCVIEEDRLVSVSEHEIASIIRENNLLVSHISLQEIFSNYIKRLLALEIEMSEFDYSMKVEVVSRISQHNILAPFDLARYEVSA
ncbi:MAG TPA: hypothetical protein VIE65_02730 [Methylobacter sp.]|jgi:hypothetical protein